MKATMLGSRTVYQILIKTDCEILQGEVVQELREMGIRCASVDCGVVANEVEGFELKKIQNLFSLELDS